MKKATLFFLLYCALGYGQLSLTGEAYYKLDILGYQSRDPNGCGDIDGLKRIMLTKLDGSTSIIWSGRKINQGVNHNLTYTKNNPIIQIQFYHVNRWKTYIGCNGGPSHVYNNVNITNSCFSSFKADAGGYLKNLKVTSKPYVKLNNDLNPKYLGSIETINITLPNDIDNKYFNWKYRVGNGQDKLIPSQYNNSNILNLKGSDFLTEADFGKMVSIWVEMNCNADTELAGRTSNVITFTYSKSAPNITNTPPLSGKTSCSDASDGSIKLQFDRAILGGEKMSVSVLPRTVNDPTFDNNPYLNLEALEAGNTLTIKNIRPGNYDIKLLGFYNGSSTYSPTATSPVKFTINKPTPVAFKTTSKNVYCKGGNDGSIAIEASGGATNSYQYSLNGGDWLAFANGKTHLITGLAPGTYKIKVRDTNLCEAKTQTIVGNEIQLGEVIEYSAVITQPASPVSLNYTFIKEPTFYGGSNGSITAAVTGGTAINNNRYDFVWQNSAGVPQTNTTTNYLNGIFTISLNNVPAGTYTLTVKDGNYDVATNKTGCGIINSTQTLTQPDPIVVTLEAQAPRCHADNPFGNETDFNPTDGQRDESQDGIITATVTGGVPFKGFANGGKPYRYFWKKQHTDGNWQDIDNQEAVLKNVAHGNYALNIEDANGIQLGTYINNVLQTPTDKIIFVQQPDKLELTFSKEDVSCGNSNNGSATAIPSGGKAPYQYEWTTGADTNTITGLVAGSYFVRVTDANGCVVQGSVNLPQPSDATILVNASPPSCRLGNDGHIELQISNGRPPFTFLWSNGATTQDINNLTAGTYTVSIRDGAANSCSFSQQVVLQDPEAFVINLGPDRTLCNGQSHDLNIAIPDPNAQYSWTSPNGFISDKPNVSLTETGTYHAKVTTTAGCIAEDDINIQSNKVVVNSEFFLSSQAYLDEKVVLVNTSDPLGENTIWVIPSDVTIVEQQPKFIVLQFNKKGTSTISLKQTQGECYATYSKSITVEERNAKPGTTAANSPYIKDFIATPNPTNGKFSVVVNLKKVNPIKLRLYLVGGDTAIVEKSEVGQKNYMVNFDEKLAVGNYILILETPQQTLVRKIIVF
jgi:hypothetical protein